MAAVTCCMALTSQMVRENAPNCSKKARTTLPDQHVVAIRLQPVTTLGHAGSGSTMFKWLRNILFGRSGKNLPDPKGGSGRDAGRLGEGVGKKYVLLSRRVSEPHESIPGFPEIYYCTKCQDYFVLAWHSQSSPLVEQCDVVQETHSAPGPNGPGPSGVFCPKCKSDYGMYGPIPHPETPIDRPEDLRVYEALEYPFPPDVPSDAQGSIRIGGAVIEKIVLLITGEFPDELNVRDFAYSGFDQIVLSRHGGDLEVAEHGGIRLHVLRLNTIVDETPWLTALLQKEVYRKPLGTKLFVTHGIVELKPPLRQALFCLVHLAV